MHTLAEPESYTEDTTIALHVQKLGQVADSERGICERLQSSNRYGVSVILASDRKVWCEAVTCVEGDTGVDKSSGCCWVEGEKWRAGRSAA